MTHELILKYVSMDTGLLNSFVLNAEGGARLFLPPPRSRRGAGSGGEEQEWRRNGGEVQLVEERGR